MNNSGRNGVQIDNDIDNKVIDKITIIDEYYKSMDIEYFCVNNSKECIDTFHGSYNYYISLDMDDEERNDYRSVYYVNPTATCDICIYSTDDNLANNTSLITPYYGGRDEYSQDFVDQNRIIRITSWDILHT